MNFKSILEAIISFITALFAKKEDLRAEHPGQQLELSQQTESKEGNMDKTLANYLWAARWNIKNNKPDSAYQEVTKALEHIGAEKPEVDKDRTEPEPDRPSKNEKGAGLNWYPEAEIITPKMTTKGKYDGGYPKGALMHFSAGRSLKGDQDAKDMLAWGRGEGYAFFVISSTGKVFQAHPLNEWGHHAGTSKWPGLGESVSSKLLGIEICNAGRLERVGDNKFKSWFGEYYTKDQVRYVEESYGCPEGYYHKYTPEQEEAFTKLMLWIERNDPTGQFSLDHVLGHHEVAGKLGIGYWRKNDPGGALSMTMPKYREYLKEQEKKVRG